MPRIQANGIELEYDEIGPKDGEPVLLVMGFTAQMTKWPDAFREGLAEAGYRVVRFDNRDIGLSYQFDEAGVPDHAAIMAAVANGEDATAIPPYTLDAMAADAAGVIDALNLGPTHVMGASMGGMIVQLMALDHADKVRSLIPVMTTSGAPGLPPPTPEALEALTKQPESPARGHVVPHGVWAQKVIGSDPSVIDSDETLAERTGRDYDRAYRPFGVARQYGAILAQPRWHERLGSVSVPTMVLHGEVDPLIPIECARDIAARVLGAKMVEIEKWGHDVPEAMVPRLLEETTQFLAEARAPAGA